MKLKPILIIIGAIILIILGIIFTPQISIWALNILFGLAIPITFKTWFAMLWIQAIVYGTTR